MDKGDRLEPGCHGRTAREGQGHQAQQEGKWARITGMGGKERKPAMLMFPSQNAKEREVHPSAFWQLEWEARQTESDRTRGSHTKKEAKRLSSVSGDINNGHPPPPGSPRASAGEGGFLCMGRGGEHGGSHSWTLRRRGRGPGGKGGGWIFTNFVIRRPGPGRGVGRGRDACRRFSRGGAGPQTKKQQE